MYHITAAIKDNCSDMNGPNKIKLITKMKINSGGV